MKETTVKWIVVDNETFETIKEIKTESELRDIFPYKINVTEIFTMDKAVYSIEEVGVIIDYKDGTHIEICIYGKFNTWEKDVKRSYGHRV